MVIGPATLVADAIVMSAVFVDLPIVNPAVETRLMLVNGQLNAEVKLLAIGSIVRVPVFLKLITPAAAKLFA